MATPVEPLPCWCRPPSTIASCRPCRVPKSSADAAHTSRWHCHTSNNLRGTNDRPMLGISAEDYFQVHGRINGHPPFALFFRPGRVCVEVPERACCPGKYPRPPLRLHTAHPHRQSSTSKKNSEGAQDPGGEAATLLMRRIGACTNCLSPRFVRALVAYCWRRSILMAVHLATLKSWRWEMNEFKRWWESRQGANCLSSTLPLLQSSLSIVGRCLSASV
ncbi:hypothetical protein B0T14DRAFT_192233 [Immersiella caudata]|uniref:Uncharacterized protein n=1 Tax=Immersiella caudata TaxID=314043 RepID=A0AA39WZD5_9PEZI|nr:hypothetical protein B0T14DRAFT_192233 [Immersiella caudata]